MDGRTDDTQAIPDELHRLTSAIQTLNTRWARRALSLAGDRHDGSPEQIYAGFERSTPETIAGVADTLDDPTRARIRSTGSYPSLPPAQADAPRNGNAGLEPRRSSPCRRRKNLLHRSHSRRQKSSSLLKRQRLQQETGPLCKLLKPFAVNHWNILLETLTDELGFDSYIDYCGQKKGIDYSVALPGATKTLIHPFGEWIAMGVARRFLCGLRFFSFSHASWLFSRRSQGSTVLRVILAHFCEADHKGEIARR